MRFTKLSVLTMVAAATVTLAAPAVADPDNDFANQLHARHLRSPRL